jgi:hypothetical protein
LAHAGEYEITLNWNLEITDYAGSFFGIPASSADEKDFEQEVLI